MSQSSPPPSPTLRRRPRPVDSDDEREEKRISIPHPSDVLRRLAMVTNNVIEPETRRLSPEETHKTMAGTATWIGHASGEDVIAASFHCNALVMRPLAGAPPDEVHADLEVGDCWNADERHALVRLVRILHLNVKRPVVVLHATFRAPPPVGLDRRAVRPRIDVTETLQRAFGPSAVAQPDVDVVRIDIRLAYPTEKAKLDTLVWTKLGEMRQVKAWSALQTRALDQTMLGALVIFKVFTADLARHLVDPHRFGSAYNQYLLMEEAKEADRVKRIEDTGSSAAYRFFLVGINTASGSIACVQAALDLGGCPLVRKTYQTPFGNQGKSIVTSVSAFDGSMYEFQPVWPSEADGIVRSVRCSVEIGAFYENHLNPTGSARRLLAILMSLAAESVAERQDRSASVYDALRRDHLMAFVYADGDGVPAIITNDFYHGTRPEERKFKMSNPSHPTQLDYGQLGLRRTYASLGLEPIAYACPGNPDGSAPSRARDVYGTRYLLTSEQMSIATSRDSQSLHVGSVDHVLHALSARYGFEPIDVAAFKPLVKTLRDFHREGVTRIGRCPDHDSFTVLESTAYAFNKYDASTKTYTFIHKAPYDEAGEHRSKRNLVQWLDLKHVVSPAAAQAGP